MVFLILIHLDVYIKKSSLCLEFQNQMHNYIKSINSLGKKEIWKNFKRSELLET